MKFRMGGQTETKRLLIIVAMAIEEKAILNALGAPETTTISENLGIDAKVFKKDGRELVLVNSGIGIVNAGLTTALVADRHKVDGVLLLGVAGAVKPSLEIGQLVIASEVIQHDSIYSGDDGPELMAPGAPFVSVRPEEREKPTFQTDETFVGWISKELSCLPHISFSVGTILSGSEFVGSAQRKELIGGLCKTALAVEMEAAGVALVAKRLKLPLAVLKTVADRLNPDHSISHDYNRFTQSAAENAGEVVALIWRSWTSED